MTEQSSAGSEGIVELTAEIVASHVQNNGVAIGDLPRLIKIVHNPLQVLLPRDPLKNCNLLFPCDAR